ncbi:hypothetical protein ACFQ1M_16020 [Sungkyunkwania multivorans]|uniref:Outer membrane protein beta-barrel domain-containing protein n=1 Tax=Sungkyunkwania multivorans TaxID=1173618 RepID=A0ABW3D339_9FLAO
MKKTLLAIAFLSAVSGFSQDDSKSAKDQFVKNRTIDISVGYGLSFYDDDVDIYGEGLYLQGEYVLPLSRWIDLRPYAGFVFTKTDDDGRPSGTGFQSNTNAFLLGGKARLRAPIPFVAPYIELGIGASIRSFETVTPATNIDKSGLLYHIPFSIGLELGRKHNFDLAFTYYYHRQAEQVAGAFAFGISIPLKD